MSKEQQFSSSDILISTTTPDSHIKYANKAFCDIAGYSLDELKNQPHNKVRHPDMPKAAFKDLWSFIRSGSSWMGPVKNKCKNGDYYWVNAFVTPIKDKNGKIHEYQSIRTKLEPEVKKRATTLYKHLNNGDTPKSISFHTDMTLWVQVLLIILVITSLLPLLNTETSIWTIIPNFTLAIVGSLFYFNWRKKYKQVTKISKAIFDNKIMSYIYSGNNDDIGTIELALKMQTAQLTAVVGRVSDDSENITTLAQQSSNMGANIANTLNEQTAETEQVATAMNQMSATIQDITQIVIQAATASQQGLDISDKGQKVVLQTVDSMNELSAQLTTVNSAIKRLVDGTTSINTVLNEISGIADQTNLLALNAAIEAARAGEQGRGFAVVAEEVRALALRSQQSTEKVSELLEQLQKESVSATETMAVGNALSTTCVNLAKQTGESLHNVNSEVASLADINTQIATAVEEQAMVSQEISNNIISIRDMASKSESSGIESVSFNKSLLTKLNEQHDLLQQFK